MTGESQFGVPPQPAGGGQGGDSGLACAEFEALLPQATEGALSGPQWTAFQAHAASCQNCGPLFALAQEGLRWMKALEEIEPPRHLVHNILAATIGREAEPAAETVSGLGEKLRRWFVPALAPARGSHPAFAGLAGVSVYRTLAQPRFAMSFGMAFFSLSLVLSVAGVKASDLRHLDLRPQAIRQSVAQQYYETIAKVVKYYENIRLVYELESRLRDLKNAATEPRPQPQPQESNPKEKRNKSKETSGQPEQNRNFGAPGEPTLGWLGWGYSQEADQRVIAELLPETWLAQPNHTWPRTES